MQLIWGRNAVYEALRGRRRVRKLYQAAGTEGGDNVGRLLGLARQQGLPVSVVPRGEIERLSGTHEHQGFLAEADDYPYVDPDDLIQFATQKGEPPLLLALDSLQDPQNLGTLLRTAEVAGVHGVLIPLHRAAEVTPAVVKASAGATEHLAIARVPNLVQAIEKLKQSGVWAFGLDSDSRTTYTQVDLSGPTMLVVGSEGFGLRRLVRQSCDGLISLPQRGRVGSLNASIAGSIVLYEALRQRIAPRKP